MVWCLLFQDFSDDGEYEEEKPLEAKPWTSDNGPETVLEIQSLTVPDRPLIKMQFIKKRKDFGYA